MSDAQFTVNNAKAGGTLDNGSSSEARSGAGLRIKARLKARSVKKIPLPLNMLLQVEFLPFTARLMHKSRLSSRKTGCRYTHFSAYLAKNS